MPLDRQRSLLSVWVLLFQIFVAEPAVRRVDSFDVLLFILEEQRLLVHEDTIWIDVEGAPCHAAALDQGCPAEREIVRFLFVAVPECSVIMAAEAEQHFVLLHQLSQPVATLADLVVLTGATLVVLPRRDVQSDDDFLAGFLRELEFRFDPVELIVTHADVIAFGVNDHKSKALVDD